MKFELQYINLLATLRQYIEDEHHISQDLRGNWAYAQDWHEGEMIGAAYKQALLAYDEAQSCFMDKLPNRTFGVPGPGCGNCGGGEWECCYCADYVNPNHPKVGLKKS